MTPEEKAEQKKIEAEKVAAVKTYLEDRKAYLMAVYGQPLLEPIEVAVIHIHNADPAIAKKLCKAWKVDTLDALARKIADRWWDELRNKGSDHGNDEKNEGE